METAYRTIALYVAHYKDWVAFEEAYYNYNPMESSASIDAIFGCGRCPDGKVPFLRAIQPEARKAATYLCSHMIRAHLGQHYARRGRPLFGHLYAIITCEEDAVMCQIMETVNRPAIRMAFDGSIYEARHIRDVIIVRNECDAAAKTIGLRIAAQQWGSPPHISDEPGLRLSGEGWSLLA